MGCYTQHIDQYQPIALSKLQFKTITKVLTDRLSIITQTKMYENQKDFVKGRFIFDGIYIASESTNHLDRKAFGGQVALKIDIKMTSYIIDWNFLLLFCTFLGLMKLFVIGFSPYLTMPSFLFVEVSLSWLANESYSLCLALKALECPTMFCMLMILRFFVMLASVVYML